MSSEETTFEGVRFIDRDRSARARGRRHSYRRHRRRRAGDLPFQELTKDLETNQSLQLFVDARAASGPSVDVSSQWAIGFASTSSASIVS